MNYTIAKESLDEVSIKSIRQRILKGAAELMRLAVRRRFNQVDPTADTERLNSELKGTATTSFNQVDPTADTESCAQYVIHQMQHGFNEVDPTADTESASPPAKTYIATHVSMKSIRQRILKVPVGELQIPKPLGFNQVDPTADTERSVAYPRSACRRCFNQVDPTAETELTRAKMQAFCAISCYAQTLGFSSNRATVSPDIARMSAKIGFMQAT